MWSVVTWARSPRDSLSVESHVVRPVPASDCQCTGNCGLSPKACWVRHSSECVATNWQRWPRCASSPTAASCAAARCSGLGCGVCPGVGLVKPQCGVQGGAGVQGRGAVGLGRVWEPGMRRAGPTWECGWGQAGSERELGDGRSQGLVVTQCRLLCPQGGSVGARGPHPGPREAVF